MSRAEYMKEWYEKNKEKIREQQKEYKQANKDKIREQQKEYKQANKDKLKEYNKEYRQTDKGKKVKTFLNWKYIGLIHDDYDDLYEKYLASTNCEECGCEYGKKGDGTHTFKCMDHNHIDGKFRNFLCCKCNLLRK